MAVRGQAAGAGVHRAGAQPQLHPEQAGPVPADRRGDGAGAGPVEGDLRGPHPDAGARGGRGGGGGGGGW